MNHASTFLFLSFKRRKWEGLFKRNGNGFKTWKVKWRNLHNMHVAVYSGVAFNLITVYIYAFMLFAKLLMLKLERK